MKMRLKPFVAYLFVISFIVFGNSACTSYKKIPYLQTKEKRAQVSVPALFKESVARFLPNDVLGITVNIIGEGSLAAEFNLPLQPVAAGDNDTYVNMGVGKQNYLIDKEGQIDFPMIGKMKVSGYTQAELENEIKIRLRKYLKNPSDEPIVTVRLLSYRITVLGEVLHPGVISVSRDHINILEVLAQVGDMTVYAKRDDVQIHREMPDGTYHIETIDISNIDVVSSPYFYLQQNDMVYVVPNRTKARNSDIGGETSIWFSLASMIFGVVNMIVYIVNR
jgi:polysaccharide export outer membrane protein